jgi:hypothetical protein
MEGIIPVFLHGVGYQTLSVMSSRETIDSGHSIPDCLPLTHIMPLFSRRPSDRQHHPSSWNAIGMNLGFPLPSN